MNILMIDTSGPACGVAIASGGQVICELQLTSGRTHSQRVMPMVDQALEMCEMTVADIDLFGAVAGPGSFTGVRIGVATVKALAHAAGKPCIGVDALEALAANVTGFDGVICPILDARAQQVYGAMFESGMPPVRMMEDTAEKLTAFLDRVEGTGCDALFVGDGAAAFEGMIRERLGAKAHFAPAQNQGLRAASACALAMQYAGNEENLSDCMTLLPLYLRAPQAERERAAKEAAKKTANEAAQKAEEAGRNG